jgi:hypothetical protein
VKKTLQRNGLAFFCPDNIQTESGQMADSVHSSFISRGRAKAKAKASSKEENTDEEKIFTEESLYAEEEKPSGETSVESNPGHVKQVELNGHANGNGAGKHKPAIGTRFTETVPDPRWLEWAIREMNWDESHALRIFEIFRDHWAAQPGQKARKVDWEATWRNWCRRETDRAGPLFQPNTSSADRQRAAVVEAMKRNNEV